MMIKAGKPGNGCIAGGAGILCTILAAACGEATAPVLLAWEAELAALGPGGVSGSVAIVSQYGRTNLSVLIEGEAGQTYGWRINEGTCAASGEIVGGNAVYPDVTIGNGGSGSEATSLPGMLDEDTDFAARVVTVGPGGGDTVVACGELLRVR